MKRMREDNVVEILWWGGGSLCIGNSKPGPKEFNKIRIRTSMQEEKATTTTIFIVRNTKNKIVKKRKNKKKDMEKGSLFLFIVCCEKA